MEIFLTYLETFWLITHTHKGKNSQVFLLRMFFSNKSGVIISSFIHFNLFSFAEKKKNDQGVCVCVLMTHNVYLPHLTSRLNLPVCWNDKHYYYYYYWPFFFFRFFFFFLPDSTLPDYFVLFFCFSFIIIIIIGVSKKKNKASSSTATTTNFFFFFWQQQQQQSSRVSRFRFVSIIILYCVCFCYFNTQLDQ